MPDSTIYRIFTILGLKTYSTIFELKKHKIPRFFKFIEYKNSFAIFQISSKNVKVNEQPQIHKMYDEVKQLVFTILDFFLKPDILKVVNIKYLNDEFRLPSNIVSFDKLYLGVEVQDQLDSLNLNRNDVEAFKQTCLGFYIELVHQILKRFDFKNQLLQSLTLLSPLNIIEKIVDSFYPLFKSFPNLILNKDIQDADAEFREIRNLNFENLFSEPRSSIDVTVFWKNVLQTKHGNESLAFPLMKKFIFEVLSLPNSSATVERIFSAVNLNKTKTRNSLATETLQGILHTKDLLRMQEVSCYNLNINSSILNQFNSSMYV